MNNILVQVDKYMHEALKSKLPEVSSADLEKDGAVFYMNGKNGTAFDWFVNEHFPCFFIFYGDKENLGAVKATLYSDGRLSVYVFGDKGHADAEEVTYTVEADADQLLRLAAFLTDNADEKKIWDADIRDLPEGDICDEQSVRVFLDSEKYYMPMIERRKLWDKTAIVSKKVRAEGWKICFGIRDEPTRDGDSGWYFGVGNEPENYANDADNLELWKVGSVLMFEPALNELISAPYGTLIIRVDHDKFEIESPEKDILIEKRES
ncbi:immunity protein Imm33 domain-containing protein [Ruminococcus albus]|uniref:Immunity protein Imm33 domain-containing protein n=1 Tax=Ruminococcus albus TaxID=1264 RepID=A0A1I1CVU2_RUMAL|nr:DUF2185 domain-containing protein [Ruminococcus albus]SFB66751.1 hypothetical protein SAMN02910406_00119 [Ruminococcus albus]